VEPAEDDARAQIRVEFAQLVASLGAYVEWQRDTGAVGFPKLRRTASAGAAAQAPVAGPEPEPEPPEDAPVAPPPAVISTPPPAPVAAAQASAVVQQPVVQQPVVQQPVVQQPVVQQPVVQQPVVQQSAPVAQQTAAVAPQPAAVVQPAATPARAPGGAQPVADDYDLLPPDLPPEEARVRLKTLADEAQACRACRLGSQRTQAVFARGSQTAKVMFVGESPGVDDDKQGAPFVGRAGQMLDKMIVAMGLSMDKDVYICNVLKCRPSDGHRPAADEVAACMPYLHQQIDLVRPRAIIALGNTAVMALLESKEGIDRWRGQLKTYRGQRLVVATYHPSFLLRPGPEQATAKKTTWEDLQLVMKQLGLRGFKGVDL
jgi:uracil-DNA glycosylase family 4